MLTRRKGLSLTALLVSQLCVAGAAVAQEAVPPPAATTPTETVGAPPADAAVEDSGGGKKKQVEEEVVVTGSRVRRKDLTTAAPVAVISREQIAASGIASIGDFLQQIPEQTGALNTNVNNGGDGETTISLRNLGSNRTLVLVDGKRWVNGGSGAGSAVDLNTIPTAAIERIEILKDGASAVYGSDAIGGVVNIITRRRPNGTELSAYAGASPHGDSQQYDLALNTGITGEKGAFFFSANYFKQESLLAGDRDWADKALTYDYASGTVGQGGSGTVPSGRASIDPSTCSTKLCVDLLAAYGAGKKTFINSSTPPAGVTGDPVVDGWRKYISSGSVNDLYNYQAVNYLITPSQRISLFANGDYHLTNFARAYVQGSFTNRQSSFLIAPEPFVSGSYGLSYSASNPFNPFGVDVPDVRRRLVELSGRTNGYDLDTFRVVTGIDGTLPAETGPLQGTFFDFAFMYGRTSGVTTTGGSLNTLQVANAIGPAFKDPTAPSGYSCGTVATGAIAGCTPVNLFAGQGPITPAQAASLGAYQGINEGFTQIAMVNANVSKELFSLASVRPVAIAAGYEHRREYGGFFPNPIAVAGNDTDFNSQVTVGSFNVNEGYAELDIPIISGIVGADDLEIQLAGRLFNYSTFGTDNTYKIGGRWRPIRDVTIRGTYSTAFRAPNVSDLYGGQAPSAEVATDPCANTVPGSTLSTQCRNQAAKQGSTPGLVDNNGDTSTQINSTVGGNPALQPETAKIGTVGIVFEPTFAKGLSATIDYWTVALSQDIGEITTPVILAGCYPAANPATATAAVNQAYCNLIQRSPTTGQLFNVSDLNANVGTLTTQGIDFAARYFMNTDFGRFGFLFDLSYLAKYDQVLADGTLIRSAGNYDSGSGSPTGGVTPRIKFNAGVTYGIGGFAASLRGRFIGGFTECAGGDGGNLSAGHCSDNNINPDTNAPYPTHSVPAYVAFDLSLSYLLRNPLGNTTFAVGVRNLTDANPPVIYNSFLTYADPTYDFAGRFVYGRLSHQF